MTQPYPLPRGIRSTGELAFDGVNSAFGPFDFKIFDVEDLGIYIKHADELQYTKVSGLTVSKTDGFDYDTFSIDFGSVHPSTSKFVVRGERTPERSVAVTKGGTINSGSLEKELSKNSIVDQEFIRDYNRSLMLDIGSVAPVVPELIGGKVLGVNSTAESFVWLDKGDAGFFIPGDGTVENEKVADGAIDFPKLSANVFSTEAEARAGFASEKLMTPERVRQARTATLAAQHGLDAAAAAIANDVALAAYEAAVPGQLADWGGVTYELSSYPSGARHINGLVTIGGSTYRTDSLDGAIYISVGENHSAKGLTYSGPTGARTTKQTVGDWCVQGCYSGFVRSGSAWSIYCHAAGNNAANVASRLSWADGPQAFTAGCEEMLAMGFGSGGIFSAESEATGVRANVDSSRYSYATGRECKVSSSRYSVAGKGQSFEVTVDVDGGGQLTNLQFPRVGSGLTVAPTVVEILDEGGAGSGGAITLTVAGGALSGGTIDNPGAGYVGPIQLIILTDCQNAEVNASQNTVATGNMSGARTSYASAVHGDYADMAGCYQCENEANISFMAACSGSFLDGSVSRVAMLASANVEAGNSSATNRSVVIGYSPVPISETNNNQNHTIRLEGNGGVGRFAGGTTTTGLDYAEMMENLEPGVIAPGTILVREGAKVRASRKGDTLPIAGVVSVKPSTLGNNPMEWQGKQLHNEWLELQTEKTPMVSWTELRAPERFVREDVPEHEGGGHTYQSIGGELIRSAYLGPVSEAPGNIPDDAEFWEEEVPLLNPDFDPSIPFVLRSDRPFEWTKTGYLGQLRVRVMEHINVDDWIGAGGYRSETPTGIRAMETIRPFDGTDGNVLAYVNVMA